MEATRKQIVLEKIDNFIDSWNEGDSNILKLGMEYLFLSDERVASANFDDYLDEIMPDEEKVQAIEYADNVIVLEINSITLQADYDRRISAMRAEAIANNEYYNRKAI